MSGIFSVSGTFEIVAEDFNAALDVIKNCGMKTIDISIRQVETLERSET